MLTSFDEELRGSMQKKSAKEERDRENLGRRYLCWSHFEIREKSLLKACSNLSSSICTSLIKPTVSKLSL